MTEGNGPALVFRADEGAALALPLRAESVAAFHARLFRALGDQRLHVTINGRANEVSDPVPFAKDHVHATCDPDYVRRFHLVLLAATPAFNDFKTSFLGAACQRRGGKGWCVPAPGGGGST